MPVTLIRVDLDAIFPPFVERMLGVLAKCRARGADYYWTSGTRFWAEQHQLRMRYLEGVGGRAAPAGFSAHQYGLAADLTFDASPRPGLQPRWDAADYDILGEEVFLAGLVWGASFNDRPHVNWPGYVSGAQLAPLRGVWQTAVGDNQARLHACWAYVEAHP